MSRTFVRVGLAPDESGTYAKYTTHLRAGYLKNALLERREDALLVEVAGSDEATTFGEIATEFIIEPHDPTRLELNDQGSSVDADCEDAGEDDDDM